MSLSKSDTALGPSWRAATVQMPVSSGPEATSYDALRRKLTGPVTYTQPSGADLFPEWQWVKALFIKLRRR